MTSTVKRECVYICPKKNRKCRIHASYSISPYCAEHLLHDPDLNEETKRSLRCPCPLSPSHSVDPSDLKRHLKVCNQRQIILGPFHRLLYNSALKDEVIEDNNDYPDILKEIDDEQLDLLIKKLEYLHDSTVEQSANTYKIHDVIQTELNKEDCGFKTRKHLEQIGSLIGQLDTLNLLNDDTCYVELGAGRGKTSHFLSMCLTEKINIDFVLIERDHQRYKFDSYHREGQQAGPPFIRYRMDIRDLYLPEIPIIKQKQSNIVVLSKHLCGSGTDLALRCVVNIIKEIPFIKAVVIAICCHHCINWTEYVGKQFFIENNFTPREFYFVRALTSWSTCENRYNQKLSDDRLLFNMKKDESIEKSSYSKRRFYSIQRQEEIGEKAKRLLDWGRVLYLKKNGFDAHLNIYASKIITLENVAIVAQPKESQVQDT